MSLKVRLQRPVLAWKTVMKEYDAPETANQIQTLDKLLSITCQPNQWIKYISEFEMLLERTKAMGIEIPEMLAITILLRELTDGYQMLSVTIRHRQEWMSLKEVIKDISAETSMMKSDHTSSNQTSSKAFYHSKPKIREKCSYCRKVGHI